jgi:two-component sensor histidine kinase
MLFIVAGTHAFNLLNYAPPGNILREAGPHEQQAVKMTRRRQRARTPAGRAFRRALKVALLYAVFATLWIFLSDLVVELLIPPGSFRVVQTVKGILFVAATTFVLYGALHRAFRRIEVSNERLRIEDRRLRESLSEQKELLQELHHRVKNNLQLTNSLLSIQSVQTTESHTGWALKRAQERILSIALVHKLAYREGVLETIDMVRLLRELTSELQGEANQKPVTVVESLDPLTLEVSRAVPLGIIAQELLTNARQHAFVPRASGEIRLELRVEDEEIGLAVQDNGMGLPDTVDPGAPKTTGFLVLATLVEQLNGRCAVSTDGGARCEVRFPRYQKGAS